jgi:hypothetical protein
MKKLDTEFESAGYKYKQIHREDMYAIYERHYISSENKHYEAIKINSHNGYEIAGNKIPPSECYPTSNSWGTHGFTCINKQAAYNRLDRMMKESAINKEKAEKRKAK